VGYVRSAYEILARKLKERDCWYLGVLYMDGDCNVKMSLKEVVYNGMGWINLG
jgi:hypothetical protein